MLVSGTPPKLVFRLAPNRLPHGRDLRGVPTKCQSRTRELDEIGVDLVPAGFGQTKGFGAEESQVFVDGERGHRLSVSVQNRRGQARRGEAIEASSSKGGVELCQGKRDSVAWHLDRRRLRNPIHVGRPQVQSEESAVELGVGEIER